MFTEIEKDNWGEYPEKNIRGFINVLRLELEQKGFLRKDELYAKKDLFFRRFSEHIESLVRRYFESANKCSRFIDVNRNHYHEITLENSTILQSVAKDSIESFHQQIYATISCFVMLLSTIIRNIPIRSLTRFYKYIKETKLYNQISTDLEILEKSREFRSQIIDHPQQHAVHDWITTTDSIDNEFRVIYYQYNLENGLSDRDNIYWLPDQIFQIEDIKLPVPIPHANVIKESLYVSPSIHKTYQSALGFINCIIMNINVLIK